MNNFVWKCRYRINFNIWTCDVLLFVVPSVLLPSRVLCHYETRTYISWLDQTASSSTASRICLLDCSGFKDKLRICRTIVFILRIYPYSSRFWWMPVQVNIDIRVFDQCDFRLICSQTFIPFLYMCPLKFRIVRPIMKQKIFKKAKKKKVARKLSPANSVARLCFCRAILLP
jgi:hypothetical protein